MCTKCNRIGRKKKKSRIGRTSNIDLGMLLGNAAASIGGYRLSNIISTRVNTALTNNGVQSSTAIVGAIKIGLGVLTAWQLPKYVDGYDDIISSGAAGMAASGMEDLITKYLPSVDQALPKVAAIPLISPAGASLPYNGRYPSSTPATASQGRWIRPGVAA